MESLLFIAAVNTCNRVKFEADPNSAVDPKVCACITYPDVARVIYFDRTQRNLRAMLADSEMEERLSPSIRAGAKAYTELDLWTTGSSRSSELRTPPRRRAFPFPINAVGAH